MHKISLISRLLRKLFSITLIRMINKQFSRFLLVPMQKSEKSGQSEKWEKWEKSEKSEQIHEIITPADRLSNLSKRKDLQMMVTRLIAVLEQDGYRFDAVLHSLANYCVEQRAIILSEKPRWELIASLLHLASDLAENGKTQQQQSKEELMMVLENLTGRSWRSQLTQIMSEVVNSLLQDVDYSFADLLRAIADYSLKQTRSSIEPRSWQTITSLLELAVDQAVEGDLP